MRTTFCDPLLRGGRLRWSFAVRLVNEVVQLLGLDFRRQRAESVRHVFAASMYFCLSDENSGAQCVGQSTGSPTNP
jgi:hypothetical protein